MMVYKRKNVTPCFYNDLAATNPLILADTATWYFSAVKSGGQSSLSIEGMGLSTRSLVRAFNDTWSSSCTKQREEQTRAFRAMTGVISRPYNEYDNDDLL